MTTAPQSIKHSKTLLPSKMGMLIILLIPIFAVCIWVTYSHNAFSNDSVLQPVEQTNITTSNNTLLYTSLFCILTCAACLTATMIIVKSSMQSSKKLQRYDIPTIHLNFLSSPNKEKIDTDKTNDDVSDHDYEVIKPLFREHLMARPPTPPRNYYRRPMSDKVKSTVKHRLNPLAAEFMPSNGRSQCKNWRNPINSEEAVATTSV